MKYQPGEIYFVREISSETGSMTPFVKIGLVTSPRVSAERLIEHQTANPRRLTIPDGYVLKTEAVSMVEAQLHRRLGKYRVGGEWFKFEENDELSEALTTARQLALEAESLSPIFLEAQRLEKEISSEEILPSTDELLTSGKLLDFNKKAKKELEAIEKQAKNFIGEMREKGEQVDAVARVQSKTYKSKFLEADFKADYPEIHKKYLVAEPSWFSSFLLKAKSDEAVNQDEKLSMEIEEVRQLVDAAVESNSIEALGEPMLAIARLVGLINWTILVEESKIKVACGSAQGIEGVCTWKRYFKTKEIFDTPLFVSEQPELYTSYLSDEVTKEYVLPSKGSHRK